MKFSIPKFKKQSRLAKKLAGLKKVSGIEHEDLKKRLFSSHTLAQKKKKTRIGWFLSQFLLRAGIVTPSEVVRKRVFWTALGLTSALTIGLLVFFALNEALIWGVVRVLASLWTFGLALIWLLSWVVCASYIDLRIHKRRKELESVLPDYLQLVAANIRAGMPIDRAMWYAVRPRFGVLAKEIEDVAKRVLTGEELEGALRDFSRKYESPMLQRSVSLLLEGIAAGGEIADLLHKISNDITEQRILTQELSANVTTYAIFITFAAIIAAPVLFGLSRQLLMVIQTIIADVDIPDDAGFMAISGDVVALSDFTIFAVVLLTGTSILSAMIVSTIKKGSVLEGLRLLPTFAFVSLTLFFLASFLFGLIFSAVL